MNQTLVFENHPAKVNSTTIFFTLHTTLSSNRLERLDLEGWVHNDDGEDILEMRLHLSPTVRLEWIPDSVGGMVLGGTFSACILRKVNSFFGDTIADCASQKTRQEILDCFISKAPYLRGQLTRAAYDCGLALIGGNNP